MTDTKDNARGALADSTIHNKWVAAYRTPEAQGFYELAFDEIARRLDAPKDAMFLDAGCGSCAKAILLAARGFMVTGSDFSADALALAQQTVHHHRYSDRIVLRQGDLLNLPFRDGEFSYILCWGVLMHVPEVERALAELARVLAPGGTLVTSEANMHSWQSIGVRTLRRLTGRVPQCLWHLPLGPRSRTIPGPIGQWWRRPPAPCPARGRFDPGRVPELHRRPSSL